MGLLKKNVSPCGVRSRQPHSGVVGADGLSIEGREGSLDPPPEKRGSIDETPKSYRD